MAYCCRGKTTNISDDAACAIKPFPKNRRILKREGQMTITVQCELVSVLVDLSYKMRITLRLLPDQKERRIDIMFRQNLQHTRRIARMRPIVERQGDLAPGAIAII